MNWDAIGAIAELVGAVAILVTLVYLAVQVKYARLATTDASRENRVVGIRDLNNNLVTNSEARVAWNKALGSEQHKLVTDISQSLDLSFDDASIVVLQGWNWMFTHWAQYRAMKIKEDEAELRNIVGVWYGDNPMLALIEHPVFRASFDSDFVDFVDEVLSSDAA